MTGHRWRYAWDAPFETGPVVVVPEADERVGLLCDAFDPYAGDHPPFGGQFETIVPHLSVAGVPFGATREAVEEILGPGLPISTMTATGVALMVEDEDGWTVGQEMPFRDGGTAP